MREKTPIEKREKEKNLRAARDLLYPKRSQCRRLGALSSPYEVVCAEGK